MRIAVPQLQILSRYNDLNRLLLTSLQRNALETTQTLRCTIVRKLSIQLNDFLTVATTNILQVELEHVVLTILAHFKFGIFELRVAQTVTEREDRLALEVHIGTSVTDVVIEQVRKVEDVAHPGLRRAARRVVLAEQNVSKTRSQLLAALRDVDDTRNILSRPVDREREAADQRNNRVVVRLPDNLDQVLGLQLDAAAVKRLAAVTRHRTHRPRSLDRLGAPVRARRRMVTYAHDADISPLRYLLGRTVGIPTLEADFDVRTLHSLLDTVKRSHHVARKSTVPVLQDLLRTVAEHRDLLHLLRVDRKDVVLVLQKDNRLLRHQQRLVLELLALPRSHRLVELHLVIRAVGIHQTQLQHRTQVALRTLVEKLVGNESGLIRRLHLLEVRVDETRQTSSQRHADRLVDVLRIVVRAHHETERTRVVHDRTVHPPLLVQDVLDERVRLARNAVVTVVRRHHRLGSGLGTLPEAVGIVFAEQLLVKLGVRTVAVVLVAVRQEVLHQGGATPVGRIVTLDTADLGGDHLAHQVRVLTEALLRAAPARITRKVSVRSPENQAVAATLLGIVTCLVGHHVAHDERHLTVPRLTDTVSLRESRAVHHAGRHRNRRTVLGLALTLLVLTVLVRLLELAGTSHVRQLVRTTADDTVDRLRAPRIGDAQARNALAYHRRNLLVHRHQGYGVVQTLLLGQLRILERILIRLRTQARRNGQHRSHDS